MKQTAGDFVMLSATAGLAVTFYLERAIWDPRGWDRNGLGVLVIATLGVAYLGWRAWRWMRRRSSN